MNEEIFYIIPENKSEWCQRNLTMIQFPLNVYKLFFATIPNIYYWNAYNPKYCYNFWIKLLCLYQSILSNRTTVFSVAKELNTVEPRLCIDYRLSVPPPVIHLSSLNVPAKSFMCTILLRALVSKLLLFCIRRRAENLALFH